MHLYIYNTKYKLTVGTSQSGKMDLFSHSVALAQRQNKSHDVTAHQSHEELKHGQHVRQLGHIQQLLGRFVVIAVHDRRQANGVRETTGNIAANA